MDIKLQEAEADTVSFEVTRRRVKAHTQEKVGWGGGRGWDGKGEGWREDRVGIVLGGGQMGRGYC